MSKTCIDLFAGSDHTILGNPDVEVSGIAFRSDHVKPGDAFFCIVGLAADGHSFAQDAIDRGASVVVVERKVYLADASDITEVVVPDTRKALAEASARFFDEPSHAFDLVGVTGTNGKTTTTYLVDHVARALGRHTGVIGTVGVSIDGVREPSERTTPESFDLQQTFARMRDAGCDVVSMEVSSHALDLKRTFGTRFAVTAFTNLTQDHLDYHKTFEDYFEAKALLFGRDYPARRAICIDDDYGRELLRRTSSADDDVISCGFDASAQIHPVEVEFGPTSTSVVLSVRGTEVSFTYPLVGRFNVSNVMLAFAICLQLGFCADDIAGALEGVEQVPGRLQRVPGGEERGVAVFVDYAHTPDAVEKAAASVRELTDGKLIVVFGCGGDRDAGKRPLMGRAALAQGDYVVVTSDNPRTEDPLQIVADIEAGMTEERDRYEVEPDRRAAIRRALEIAGEGDAVLIAGKGHEDYQLVGSEVLSFDDVEVAAEELAKLAGASGSCGR